ncbi:MAG: hypothetical protein EHM60_03125 [Lysobacterales bacterium]|jgi:glutaredoxin|nr:MAG: hypothetical protein EHM60_03125 [Xanthomonadales bacterium]
MSVITVYWQPGCTSCLRTKEFLHAHGVPFESVNVREQPTALADLARLGAKSVPTVVRDGRHVNGQDLDALARFVGIPPDRPRLPVPVLVSRLLALLDASAHLAGQIPDEVLHEPLTGRDRTTLDLAYHVPQVVVGFLDAALGGRLTTEHFERKPPEAMRTAAGVAGLTRSVSQAVAVWWGANQSRLPAELDTYYGPQTLHDLLERTTWHVAQHARQLEHLLTLRGRTPVPGLPVALLDGLPLPAAIWDTEVPLR